LHTNYPLSQSQYNFAISQLESNNNIKLVTLNIGANDALLVVGDCLPAGPGFAACLGNNLPTAIGAYAQNLATILSGIRSKYKGTIVVLNAYSPDPNLDFIAQLLNQVTAQVSPQFGAKVADAYGAFASMSTGGNVCAAGLLIPVTATTCDQHPSPLGQKVLAAAIEDALGR